MRYLLKAACLLVVLLAHSSTFTIAATNFFPDTGKAAITQHALELREHLRVISITLRPGEEDFAALAYLRMGRGAQLTNLYVTNGEKGELDAEELYPFDVAAVRRVEASKAMMRLDAEAIFMNMPDLDGALSPKETGAMWHRDTLAFRLQRVIEPTQPDLILVMSDKREGSASAATALLRETLLQVCARLKVRPGQVLVEGSTGVHMKPFVRELHPVWKVPYASLGDSAGAAYASIQIQRHAWEQRAAGKYAVIYPRGAQNVFGREDFPLAGRMPDSLRALDKQIRDLAQVALGGRMTGRLLVPRILPMLQAVDRAIGRLTHETSLEHKIVLDWKEALERLRASALGVSVRYSLEYAVLCERQLVRFGINEIHAGIPTSAMELLIPEVGRGWIVNESLKNRIPVKAGDTLRLITPERIDYDLPFAQNVDTRPTVGHMFSTILVHAGMKREESFVYRITPRLFYAPRFTAETLTPVVRWVDGEQLVTRLTNHSRDGVADQLMVNDSLASSTTARVALSWKETAKIDTLRLAWRDSVADGSYVIPVTYGGVPATRFVARKFACNADTLRKIGLLSGWKSGAAKETLRRLGYRRLEEISPERLSSQTLTGVQTIIIDRRALTLKGLQPGGVEALKNFTAGGGHLVILAQDPVPWNGSSLWSELHLEESNGLPPGAEVTLDSLDALLAGPNRIGQNDFAGWLHRRSFNTVQLRGAGSDVRVPVRSRDGMPLMATRILGKGRMTYLDLAMGPQWMNVDAGAFRILANVVAQ